MSSYFFLQLAEDPTNTDIIHKLSDYSNQNRQLVYILDRPLTDQKYSYRYKKGFMLLSPGHKISILNYGTNPLEFEDYVEDLIEDIASISDKYMYKDVIGRSRNWRSKLINTDDKIEDIENVANYFEHLKISNEKDKKHIDLIISLLIGSINDIDRVGEDVPVTTLDKIKQKIQLYDGDQTRFVYEKLDKKKIRIQGLSGTGKTELLMHKLKDLYTIDTTSKIFFTCHNKILADNLKKRIPSFFNFMKVEQQIEWNKRLWCTNAWGGNLDLNSGAYRYICSFYQIPFYRYSFSMSFSNACKLAIDEIKAKYNNSNFEFAFTYMLIDESQDFDENFFDLCALVTEKNVYIAGDIFQSIFDEEISSTIEPDYLLGKCYRTDPKTLMFAHALGMGLFEKNKLRWLEKKEWEDCGYSVEIKNSKYHLSREPVRRFEDIEENFESIKILSTSNKISDGIIQVIKEIKNDNSTLTSDDIGIILLDQDEYIYELADILANKIYLNFNWVTNKAYETKERINDTVLISNRNNVKGLEFPFVICVTKKIKKSPSYRNSVYTMLTRSFIKSYLLIPSSTHSGITKEIISGLNDIINNNKMIIEEPTESEKIKIRTRFKYNMKKLSHFEIMLNIFKQLKVEKKYQEKLLATTQQMDMLESDPDTLTKFIKDNLKYLKQK